MGEYMVRKSIKFPAWMLERILREKERFEPFCENDSDVVRFFLRIVFRLIDAGMIGLITAAMQGTLGHTVCASCGAHRVLAGGPDTTTTGPRSAEDASRPRPDSSRLESCRVRVAGLVVSAYGSPSLFPDGFRRSFAGA